MIAAQNPNPGFEEFQCLMKRTDTFLNKCAEEQPNYYDGRGGTQLEEDVFDALSNCARGTPFEGIIQLISGICFPDIVAAGHYGVEVKSTQGDYWTSTGSSILESTRREDVRRIFLTFGKLKHPAEFLSRPYEECLSGIAVTHYPRYRIDMKLHSGETIFDKMGVSYEELRQMDDPIRPVSKYYSKFLHPGEKLWWAGDGETNVGAILRMWNTLSSEERKEHIAQGYARFPRLFERGGRLDKYNEFAFWLVLQRGVVCHNLRDTVSAGGRREVLDAEGHICRVSAAIGRAVDFHSDIATAILQASSEDLGAGWGRNVENDRVSQWCRMVADMASRTTTERERHWSVLMRVFPGIS